MDLNPRYRYPVSVCESQVCEVIATQNAAEVNTTATGVTFQPGDETCFTCIEIRDGRHYGLSFRVGSAELLSWQKIESKPPTDAEVARNKIFQDARDNRG